MKDEVFAIVFAGGGSGGHVYPMLAVIEAIRKRFGELGLPVEMTRMGPRDGYETLFVNQGVSLSPIIAGKVRRYASAANFLDIPKFIVGCIQALIKLYFIMPHVIFSKGGTGALPVVFAAWLYRIPVVIHESDARPGLTNLASARFAKKVFVGFGETAKYFNAQKTAVVGTPIRNGLLGERTTSALAKETLGFSGMEPLVLFVGGSQGSERINEFILENLQEIAKNAQVLHQTGTGNLAEAEKLSRAALIDESFKNRYQPIGYLDDKTMKLALTAADLVVARAGANTIAEIAAFGAPAILIPLAESANDHQRINAYAFAKNGAAIVIEEANLLPGIFLGELRAILSKSAMRAKMAAASGAFFVPGAAEKIAQEIIALGARQGEQ